MKFFAKAVLLTVLVSPYSWTMKPGSVVGGGVGGAIPCEGGPTHTSVSKNNVCSTAAGCGGLYFAKCENTTGLTKVIKCVPDATGTPCTLAGSNLNCGSNKDAASEDCD